MALRFVPDAPGRRTGRYDGHVDGSRGGGSVTRTRTKTSFAALAVMTLLAAACSNVSSSTPAGGSGSGTVPDHSGTTLHIAISPWQGSAANVAIAEKR